MAETLLTEGDTTTTDTDDNASTENTTTEETTTVETFDADGKPTEGGEFDKDGKKIEVEEPELDKDGKPIEKTDDEPEGAPETYADYTLPEGIEINETDLTEFNTIAKELNLTQDQAQSLVDLQSKRAEANSEAVKQALTDAFQKQQEDWVSELKADKDFGGDNLDKNVGLSVKVINKFGSPGLKAVLDSSGMGNNPEFIKTFNNIGKAISEDSLDPDNNQEAGTGKSVADKLYPNQGKS